MSNPVESSQTVSPEPPLPLRVLRRLGLLRGLFREAAANRPVEPLELYSMEGCPACRRVRRTLTELEIDFLHRSSPRGGTTNRAELARRGGKMQVPYLIDPNSGAEMYESREIVRYLREHYGAA